MTISIPSFVPSFTFPSQDQFDQLLQPLQLKEAIFYLEQGKDPYQKIRLTETMIEEILKIPSIGLYLRFGEQEFVEEQEPDFCCFGDSEPDISLDVQALKDLEIPVYLLGLLFKEEAFVEACALKMQPNPLDTFNMEQDSLFRAFYDNLILSIFAHHDLERIRLFLKLKLDLHQPLLEGYARTPWALAINAGGEILQTCLQSDSSLDVAMPIVYLREGDEVILHPMNVIFDPLPLGAWFTGSYSEKIEELYFRLKALGADLHVLDEEKYGSNLFVPAICCESMRILEDLVQEKVDINHLDSEGKTPLDRAYELNSDPRILEFLLQNGALQSSQLS